MLNNIPNSYNNNGLFLCLKKHTFLYSFKMDDMSKLIKYVREAQNLFYSYSPSKKKYKERRRKGAPLIMSLSSKTELWFSKNGGSAVFCGDAIEVHRTEWFAVHRFYSSFGVPFLLLFWSSITTPLLELRYYTPLLELCYYSSLIRVRLEHLCYTFSRALLLNPIGANWNNY